VLIVTFPLPNAPCAATDPLSGVKLVPQVMTVLEINDVTQTPVFPVAMPMPEMSSVVVTADPNRDVKDGVVAPLNVKTALLLAAT
jgi:hypothetical protein